MSTRPGDIQAGNLRRFTDRELTVRIDGDQFRTTRNNAFSRLVVWAHTDLLPSIRTRRVTEARERFIAAVGNRAGSEAGAAPRDVRGAGSTPLTSRDVRQVSGTPTWREPGRPLPAPRESGASRSRVPGPGDPPDTRSATPRATGHAAASLAAPQDPSPAAGSIYRESQVAGTDLSGMHALNAFFGGPVIGADEYKRMRIEVILDMLGVPGERRDDSPPPIPSDASSDETLDSTSSHAAVETGVTIPDAAEHPRAHAQARARINAFPGDRLIVGYPRGGTGDTHMVALRREEDGHWQVHFSPEPSAGPPMRADSLADCLDALPDNLLIVHLEEDFRFQEHVAASQLPGGQVSPDPLPTPDFSDSEATEPMDSQHIDVESSPDPLPTPDFSECEATEPTDSQHTAVEGSPDPLPTPDFSESESPGVLAQDRGSPSGPPDNPSAAVAGPTEPTRSVAPGAIQVNPLLEPYRNAGIPPEYAQPLLDAQVPPQHAALFLKRIRENGDDPREVFRSGIPISELRTVYRHGYDRHGYGLREARLLYFDANMRAAVLDAFYGPHRLRLTPDTLIRYTDSKLTGFSQHSLKGGQHSPYFVMHDDGVIRVFKPLEAPHSNLRVPIERGWAAVETGIDRYNPQTAMRNIMTCRLAEELEFDVVVETELGLHGRPGAPPGAPPRLGLVMERAPGRSAAKYTADNPLVFELPDVRREVTKLQLLDCLTAQADRSIRNYFIDVRRDGGIRVAGIDNDQCFGKSVHDPDTVRRGQAGTSRWGFRSCGLPPVIDIDMTIALWRLAPERVREMLADRLSPEEVEATVHRLDAIKNHIVRLRREGRIIAPDDWGDPALHEITNFNDSYFARESATGAGVADLGGFRNTFAEMGLA